jgi:hypothetical protein
MVGQGEPPIDQTEEEISRAERPGKDTLHHKTDTLALGTRMKKLGMAPPLGASPQVQSTSPNRPRVALRSIPNTLGGTWPDRIARRAGLKRADPQCFCLSSHS